MKMTQTDAKIFWNTRAKSFPGHVEGNTYQGVMLEAARKLNVEFKNKHVLDLGCGAGSYTLRIADMARHVVALDISRGMLDKVASDAAKMGVTNITTVEADWLVYSSDDIFDVIFCSLTPAVGSVEALDKLNSHVGATAVVIAFVNPIKAYVLEELFQAHNASFGSGQSDRVVRHWLESKKIPFSSTRIIGEWITMRTYDEMVDNCFHVLDAHSIKPDKNIIEKVVDKYRADEGLYESKTGYDVEIMVWNVN